MPCLQDRIYAKDIFEGLQLQLKVTFFSSQHHIGQARTKILLCYLSFNPIVDVTMVKVTSDYGAIQGPGKSQQCDLKHPSFDGDEFLQCNCLFKIPPFKTSFPQTPRQVHCYITLHKEFVLLHC